ncbi:unnamed protein product [Trichobilharzia regenti]|nr:unnamed protein product [Trichobilharzia regenti]
MQSSRNRYDFRVKILKEKMHDILVKLQKLPAAVSHIAWGLITLEAGSGMSWFLLNEIGNLLIVVNSAINLLPYYIFSRKFRRHFVRTFWPYRCIRDNGLHCIYIPEWATRSINHYDDAEDSEMAGTSTLHNYHPRMNMRNFSNYRLSIHRNNSSSYRPRPSLPSNIRTSSCESQKLFSHIFRPVFYNTRRKKSKAASLSCESKPTLQMQMQDRGKGVTKGVQLNQCQNDEEAKDVAENHKIQKKDSLPCENNINNIDNTNNSNINNNTKSSSLHTLPYRGSNSSHSSVSFQIRDNVNQSSSSLSSTSMPLRLLHCKKKSISEFKFSKSIRFHSKSEADYSTRKLNRDCNDDGNDDDHEGTADDKDNINSKNGDNGDNDTATPSTEHLQSLEEVSSNPDSVDIA